MPLDERLGLDQLKHSMTDEMRVEVAFMGQNQASFEDASDMIFRMKGMEISDETVRQVTEEIGQEVFESDKERAQDTIENMHKIEFSDDAYKLDRTLYIEIDGAAVNTRVEDENGSTWRECKNVLVFTDKDIIKRKDGSHKIVRREYSALIGSAEEFKGFVLNAALNMGYGKVKRVALIADGAAWIRNLAEEIFPDAIQILDLYHLKENIYTYAKEKFGNDEEKYVPWAESIIALIEEGAVDEALQEIGDVNESRTVNLRGYIENNRERINYPEYKKQKFFVGSGAIEAANKTIVQRRLKQAGMRWSVSGAQAVLALRCKVESGLWSREVHDRVCA